MNLSETQCLSVTLLPLVRLSEHQIIDGPGASLESQINGRLGVL